MNIPSTMRAIVIDGVCAAEDMAIREIPVPEVKPGWVLVKVHAAGVNRAEIIMREEEADEPYIATPIVPGIECSGEVADPSDSGLEVGDRVVGIMGGMGRSFDGGYAEYCLVPEENLFTAKTCLPWAELAAVPETWFTAYGSLFQSLQLKEGDTLLVRGGTSPLGIAAIQLAKGAGATVAATSRSTERAKRLYDFGADMAMLDDGTLADQIRDAVPEGFDCILELVGPKTLIESLTFAKNHGCVCMTGVLGGVESLDGFDPIKDIPPGVYLTGFFSNYPTQDDIDAIFSIICESGIRPYVGAVYPLEEAGTAQKAIEGGKTFGKTVLSMDGGDDRLC